MWLMLMAFKGQDNERTPFRTLLIHSTLNQAKQINKIYEQFAVCGSGTKHKENILNGAFRKQQELTELA